MFEIMPRIIFAPAILQYEFDRCVFIPALIVDVVQAAWPFKRNLKFGGSLTVARSNDRGSFHKLHADGLIERCILEKRNWRLVIRAKARLELHTAKTLISV